MIIVVVELALAGVCLFMAGFLVGEMQATRKHIKRWDASIQEAEKARDEFEGFLDEQKRLAQDSTRISGNSIH